MTILLLLGWFVICVILMSYLEYIPHRWLMHKFGGLRKTYEHHALLHHKKYYKVFNNEPDAEGKFLNLRLTWILDTIAVIPICVLLSLLYLPAGFIMFGVYLAHHLIWNAIHVEMHVPQGRFFSKWKVYDYLHKYHWMHHRYPGKNFNIVLPFADFVFGTHIKMNDRDREDWEKYVAKPA